METRKLQQVGYSTMVVSLPHEWVKELGLRQGDRVTFEREDDGVLRLVPGEKQTQKVETRSVINSELAKDKDLLSRIITGSYILGRDSIRVTSNSELDPEHLEEVRNTVQRLTGVGIVEQTLQNVTILNFMDPTKFPVSGLIRRLHLISSSMLNAGMQALVEGRADLGEQVMHMEDEVDKIYWLVVRQLLLCAQDSSMSKLMGIQSPLHVVGNRVIAKSLEEMGDAAERIAQEAISLAKMKKKIPKDVANGLLHYSRAVEELSEKTMKALFDQDIRLTNEVIEDGNAVALEERDLTERILTNNGDIKMAVALREVVSNLRQMAEYCNTIAELTMNRILESSSDYCHVEKVKPVETAA